MNERLGAASHREVTLRDGGDAEAAERLRGFLRDAQDGVRRIAIAGAYCDWIVSQLPHGRLSDWLAVHVPDMHERTVRKWRQFALDLFAAAKRPRGAGITVPTYKLLAANVDELPEEDRDARAAVEEILAGKTYRQLTFEFRQTEQDADGNLRVKRGRLKGCKQDRTSKGAKLELEERQALVRETLADWTRTARALSNDADLGLVAREDAAAALDAAIDLNNKLRLLAKGRAG